ncbi:glycosyltransferase involved in cell wall biosynthesis [Neorhizobium galegae]|uniref:glycosyltransferase family 4 protein n=1 Tax=Neorhizobium galegae TaxID=399 RepID=UPI001AEA4229|nr:glycosyltransferase family 4 protein [Neorhizobium galegae]MBP2550637.1 glycosyltransferase involved in cell wall biosynthesis [Neorhizobium galegae]
MSGRLVLAYPGRLETSTGGYAYDRRLIEGLRCAGWTVETLGLGDGFPNPSAEQLQEAEARLDALPDETLVMIDGLAFGVMDRWAERSAARLRVVALVHHPLALETGLTPVQQATFQQVEMRALSHVRHIVVTSPATARGLTAHYGVAEEKITVALPGTERAPVAKGNNVPPHILTVGTLTRRKGHDVLLKALDRVRDLAWHATIVGSRDLDPVTTAELEMLRHQLKLTDRVTFAGERADVRLTMSEADIFALASRYEGYGMVFAEALSQGLPVVACLAGAIPDVVPKSAGLLVAVDDVEAFAAALRRLLTSSAERRKFADAAFIAGLNLPGWPDTAAIVSSALHRLS